MIFEWHNPNWGEADVTCPQCGTGWDDVSLYDDEYGYFMADDGTETVTCDEVRGGCGHKFRVKRSVTIEVKHEVIRLVRKGDAEGAKR